MSIRWKLGIVFLVISLVPLIIFSMVSIDRTQQMLKQEIGLGFELIAREKAMGIASVLNRRVDEAISLASNPRIIAAVVHANSFYQGKDDNIAVSEIDRIDRAWIKSKGETPMALDVLGRETSIFLRDYQGRDLLEYGEIFITDRLGATVAMTATLTDYYQADEGWWREGFVGGKGAVYIDDRGYDLSINAVVTGVVAPVRVGGEVLGLLKINFKMAHIPAIISNPYGEEDVFVFMHRSNGTAVLDTSDGRHENVNETEARIIVEGAAYGWIEDNHELEPTIMGYAKVQPQKTIYSRIQAKASEKGISGETWGKSDWYVFVERTRAKAYAPLTRLMGVFIFGGVVMAITVVLMASVMAARITTPLLKLRKGMKAIAAGDLDFKVDIDREDEIGEVQRDIDMMVGRLKKTLTSRDELNHEIVQREKIEEALQKRSIELELSKAEAEAANMAKSEFLASMSHELRTPLNAVLGFAQMLQFDPKNQLSSDQNAHVEHILEGGEHLLELINEVLDLARIEARQLDLSLEEVDAYEVVTACVALTVPLGERRGIKIIEQFSSEPLGYLRTDHLRLKQVLLNLLSNAVKYNRDGGTVTVEGRETEDGFLRLSVSDTGIGIAEKDYSDVFQMFHRLGADPMIAREGTGIGLTVTKLLVERMAGRVGFESEVGVGSTFWFELPWASNENVIIWVDSLSIG
ncbi:MAG: HAMP domain-containing protein, partial [Rhodospirillales bacterium]|nr:HAMP domain-containing protein [Rhodospirillales bacterium]